MGDSGLQYIYPLNSGDYILGGLFRTTVGFGFIITKQDAFGNTIWSRNYSKGNGPILRSMTATNDGGYIMFGIANNIDTNVTTHVGGVLSEDLWVLKLDSNGYKVWSKVYGGTQNEEAVSVIPAPRGGSYIYGYTFSNDYDCTGNHGGVDGYLARLDSNGNMMWHHCLGGTGNEAYGAMVSNRKNGVLIANAASSPDGEVHHYHGGDDFWVLEADSNGTILWDNCYGGTGIEDPNSICKAKDGTIWIAGSSSRKNGDVYANNGNIDAWVVHTDSAGNLLNSRVIGSSAEDKAQVIYPLLNNNVIVGGYYSAAGTSGEQLPSIFYGYMDIFLAELSPEPEAVYEIPFADAVALFPNPVSDILNIKLVHPSKLEVCVIDLLGRQWYHASPLNNQKVQIAVKDWPRGLYVVKIESEDGYQVEKKVVIQ